MLEEQQVRERRRRIAGLKGAKLAAQQGTTSFDAINNVIKPGTTPAEFPTNDLAVQALKNGQVDGLVVDLPTGVLRHRGAGAPTRKIVGQLPVTGKPEQFGLVLRKGSSLTSCVSQAVDALRSERHAGRSCSRSGWPPRRTRRC